MYIEEYSDLVPECHRIIFTKARDKAKRFNNWSLKEIGFHSCFHEEEYIARLVYFWEHE